MKSLSRVLISIEKDDLITTIYLSLRFRMFLKNNRGFAIVQVMILAGVIGGFSYIAMKYASESRKDSAKLQFATDISMATSAINDILADETVCLNTFKPTTTPLNIAGKYPVNIPDANSKLVIKSYSIAVDSTMAQSKLTITFQNKAILQNGNSPNDVSRQIKIFAAGVDYPNMTSCRSVGVAKLDIWSRQIDSPNIYYTLGNIGIGTSAPTVALDVVGESKIAIGYAIVAKSYAYTSDKRLKNNIEQIKNPLEKVLSLRGVTFDWRSNNKRDFGLIAQEVQKQIPEIVSYNPNEDMLAVEYSKVIPFLIEALKFQQTELNELQNDISILRKDRFKK